MRSTSDMACLLFVFPDCLKRYTPLITGLPVAQPVRPQAQTQAAEAETEGRETRTGLSQWAFRSW